MSYAIIRNSNYKMKNLSGIYRHNERKNTNYSNKDIDKNKSIKNYSLKQSYTTYEKSFKIIKNQYNLKGQLKTVSNVVCEYIITSDKEYFDSIGEKETKRFFRSAYSFVSNYKNLGEQFILSAKVHMDERTPHMHVVFIPVIHTKDKKGNKIDKIACSEFWKGKNSYQYLQDNFHKYMNICGFDLERGKKTENQHLTLEQIKGITKYDKIKEEIEQTPIHETTSNSLEMVISENKKLVNYSNKLRQYCMMSSMVLDKCKSYETNIKKLEQENQKLRNKVTKLKEYIQLILQTVEKVFKISKEKFLQFLERTH